MSYRLLYGDRVLFDPYTDDVVYDAKLTAKVNTCDFLDFTIPRTHSLYAVLKERADDVSLFWDKTKLFQGKIEKIEQDIEGNLAVSCNGILDRLSDTLVRPYSTVAGEQDLKAPSTVDGLFKWYIEQHNNNGGEIFKVGVNQGYALDPNNYIYRSSEQLPTTWDEINNKILNSLGGYLFYDYSKNELNLYSDVHEVNAQILDFGENIVDITKSLDSAELYSVIRPSGATPEGEEDSEEKQKAITIEELPDGKTSYNDDFYKQGDVVYSRSAVQEYGWREYKFDNSDCTTADGLLSSACSALVNLISPAISLSIKAVDCALYMKNYTHLQAGQAVRVRSAFHGLDDYLMVNTVELDLQDPSQSTYEIGAEYRTLTGQQSSYLRSLTTNINFALDATTSLDSSLKATAKDAKEAKASADKAVQTTADEYVISSDSTNPPLEGWSTETPEWSEGTYIWRRTVVSYGDGTTTTGNPALLTGNTGASGRDGINGRDGADGKDGTDGKDAITVSIASSDGFIFKNSSIKTTLTAHVYQGGKELTPLTNPTLASVGTIKWFKNNEATFFATGQTLKIAAGEEADKVTYTAKIDG